MAMPALNTFVMNLVQSLGNNYMQQQQQKKSYIDLSKQALVQNYLDKKKLEYLAPAQLGIKQKELMMYSPQEEQNAYNSVLDRLNKLSVMTRKTVSFPTWDEFHQEYMKLHSPYGLDTQVLPTQVSPTSPVTQPVAPVQPVAGSPAEEQGLPTVEPTTDKVMPTQVQTTGDWWKAFGLPLVDGHTPNFGIDPTTLNFDTPISAQASSRGEKTPLPNLLPNQVVPKPDGSGKAFLPTIGVPGIDNGTLATTKQGEQISSAPASTSPVRVSQNPNRPYGMMDVSYFSDVKMTQGQAKAFVGEIRQVNDLYAQANDMQESINTGGWNGATLDKKEKNLQEKLKEANISYDKAMKMIQDNANTNTKQNWDMQKWNDTLGHWSDMLGVQRGNAAVSKGRLALEANKFAVELRGKEKPPAPFEGWDYFETAPGKGDWTLKPVDMQGGRVLGDKATASVENANDPRLYEYLDKNGIKTQTEAKNELNSLMEITNRMKENMPDNFFAKGIMYDSSLLRPEDYADARVVYRITHGGKGELKDEDLALMTHGQLGEMVNKYMKFQYPDNSYNGANYNPEKVYSSSAKEGMQTQYGNMALDYRDAGKTFQQYMYDNYKQLSALGVGGKEYMYQMGIAEHEWELRVGKKTGWTPTPQQPLRTGLPKVSPTTQTGSLLGGGDTAPGY